MTKKQYQKHLKGIKVEAPQDNWEEEKELFEEIAREWLRGAPPMETIYRFKRIWGWRIQKHLNECEEVVKKILQNKQH